MSEWQPIETAPKDGTVFLAFFGLEEMYVGSITDGEFWPAYGAINEDPWMMPLNWQPLPPPPDSKIPQQYQPK